ncbi:hypothetical protein SSX86_011881 [Deinandra increscens subsp. villosa]|uniref:WRKY domain-containing protein n=1 Tax=Deinandra increscens subsp. villosa TaxID=3103831 RepID=A0AAP0H2Q2_9ASTR
MESSSSWPENLPSSRIKAIQELTKGQILTNRLRELLDRPKQIESDSKSVNVVVDKILKIRRKIRMKASETKTHVKTKRGCYKRRKNSLTTTKVTSTLIDDGYAWRKYGQKTILNSKHQRNYYRCSHKNEKGCQATKQVQKTNEEPSKYMITYNGFHTCNSLYKAPQIIREPSDIRDNSTLISFETNALIENNKVGTCFPSMKHTPKEDFPYLDRMKQEQVSSSDHYAPWVSMVGLSQIPPEPMSIMSSGIDREDVVSSEVLSSTYSTHGYEIDDINDFDDLIW